MKSEDLDIRWKQRFNNFDKALSQLKKGLELSRKREVSNIEKQGIIKAFEFTFELAWNLLRDYLMFQGIYEIRGSRDAIKLAYKYGLIDHPEVWLEMLTSRNLTSHTYNEEVALEILQKIQEKSVQELQKLWETFIFFKEEEN